MKRKSDRGRFPYRGRGFQGDFFRGSEGFQGDRYERQDHPDRVRQDRSPRRSPFRTPSDPKDECKACGGNGHWARDRNCPNFKKKVQNKLS